MKEMYKRITTLIQELEDVGLKKDYKNPTSLLTEEKHKQMTRPENPIVSVIIPSFNHGKYLREAVDSILNQTYKNLEIIVVNDGSSDETVKVASELVQENKVNLFINLTENKGKWYALNEAIKAARGIVITNQDADDLAHPERIMAQLRAMESTGAVHCLCGFHHCFSEEDVTKHKEEFKIPLPEKLNGINQDKVATLVHQGFVTPGINHYYTGEFETAGTSAMFLKSLWDIGFRYNPPGLGLRIKHSEDSDFNQRLTLALRNTVVLAEKLYLYRRWTSSHQESR